MKSKSCKAKGRELQNEVRDALRALAKELGYPLIEEDICGREMGQRGCDVRLSPLAARALGKLLIECKNKEKFNALGDFNKHLETYAKIPPAPDGGVRILVHTRNARPGKRKQPRLVLLQLEDFIRIYADYLRYRDTRIALS